MKSYGTYGVPYDFISTHAYSSCQMAGLGDVERVVKDIQTVRALHFPLSHSFSHTNLKSPCAEQARAGLDNVTATNCPMPNPGLA